MTFKPSKHENEVMKAINTADARERLCDTVLEMRGLCAVLFAASHGDIQEPGEIVEYAAIQVGRFADDIAEVIRESHPQEDE